MFIYICLSRIITRLQGARNPSLPQLRKRAQIEIILGPGVRECFVRDVMFHFHSIIYRTQVSYDR